VDSKRVIGKELRRYAGGQNWGRAGIAVIEELMGEGMIKPSKKKGQVKRDPGRQTPVKRSSGDEWVRWRRDKGGGLRLIMGTAGRQSRKGPY